MSFLALASLVLVALQARASVMPIRAPAAAAKCQKYVDSASKAASALQSEYFKDGTYGDQAIWIGAVDAFYLNRCKSILTLDLAMHTHMRSERCRRYLGLQGRDHHGL